MKANDIIQIEPFHPWGGCLAVVAEVKNGGVLAYVQVPNRGTTYIRLTNDEYQSVGAEVCFILDCTENTEEKPYRGDNDD